MISGLAVLNHPNRAYTQSDDSIGNIGRLLASGYASNGGLEQGTTTITTTLTSSPRSSKIILVSYSTALCSLGRELTCSAEFHLADLNNLMHH